MKKSDFIKKVTEYVKSIKDANGEQIFDVTQKESDAYLEAIKEAIIDTLADGDEVVWPRFARFYVADQAERNAHNPRTGEIVKVPAKKKVKIKVLSELKNAVQ